MIFISSRLLQELKRIPDCAAGVINGVTRNSPDGFTSAREAAFCKTHGRYAPGVAGARLAAGRTVRQAKHRRVSPDARKGSHRLASIFRARDAAA
jgi:hypothetical protein